VLVIVALFARERRHSAGGRFLLVCLGLALLVALGARLTVAGRQVVWLPWSLLHDRPLFDNVLTTRIALYVALASAVVVALWAAGARGAARYVLPGLAVLALAPDPSSGGFATAYSVPAFFTASRYRDCLDRGETIVPFPFRGGSSLLWQVDRAFRWRLAGGDIGPEVPAHFLTPDALPVAGGGPLGADDVANVRTFLAARGATTVVVDGSEQASWARSLDPIAKPQPAGGVVLYRLTRYPPPCPP
jgi:hypothetical protein